MKTISIGKEELDMRVIAGKARRLPLVSPEGRGTRPTTDRIKETLFNILQDDIPGCRFLDLFSGSGAIGIEAISRGAKEAVFVEFGKEALSCIRANLEIQLPDFLTLFFSNLPEYRKVLLCQIQQRLLPWHPC